MTCAGYGFVVQEIFYLSFLTNRVIADSFGGPSYNFSKPL